MRPQGDEDGNPMTEISLPDRCPVCGATTRHGKSLEFSTIAAWCEPCGWSVDYLWSADVIAPPSR